MATDIKINVSVEAALRELDKLSKKIETLSDKTRDSFGKMSEYTGRLTAALAAAGTAVAMYADDITDIADANQVAIGQVLGLSKALEASGGKADAVGRFFQTLSNNIEEANAGNLKSVATFQRLGVSIDDLGRLSNTALKDKLLDGLVKIKDPIERNALAMQIFGKTLVGVDIEKFIAKQKELSKDMDRYTPAIKTAGDAWDNMAALVGKLKLAFAEAFQPVFWLLSKITVNVDAAVVAFRLLGIAVLALVGPAVLGGMAKLITLVATLTTVAMKNPLIAIGTALLAIGPIAAEYLGITKLITGEQEKSNDIAAEGQRNQEGLNDALKKQQDSLKSIREALENTWKKQLDRLALETEMLGLNEEQKKVREEQLKVDQDIADQVTALDKKYAEMDAAARAMNKTTYEQEIKQIKETGEAQKLNLEARIKGNQTLVSLMKDLQATSNEYASAEVAIFESRIKNVMSGAGYAERIDLENKLAEAIKTRAVLMKAAEGVSERERAAAIQVIGEATTQVDMLKGSYTDLFFEMQAYIDSQVKLGVITQDTADKILKTTSSQRSSIAFSSEAIAKNAKEMEAQSRTWSAGWNKAFAEYADNAFNSAQEAQRVFQRFTQGMEDTLMGFFKTGKFEWKNFIQSMVDELLRSQIRQLMASVFNFGSTASNAGGGLLSGLGKLMGFANGGIIPTNGPVIVGERGPEVLTGAAGRTVIPNDQLGGSSNVVYNISAVDAMSFKAMIARDPTFLYAVTEQGRRSLPGGR